MTNRELLKQMTDEELARFFCTAMEPIGEFADKYCCDLCPVEKLCGRKKNGFLVWLQKEHKEEQK